MIALPVFFDSVEAVPVDPVAHLKVTSPRPGTVKAEWKYRRPVSHYLVSMEIDGETDESNLFKTDKNQYEFSNLDDGHNYRVYVWAVRSDKKSPCRTASVYVEKIINAPVIAGKSDGYRRIDLSWEPVEDAEGYVISETKLATGATEEQTLAADTTSISYYDKATGASYEYKVKAFVKENNKRKHSGWSEAVTVTAKSTTIGQAASDTDGRPGDGSGREVATAPWGYSSSSSSYKNWTYVFRFKDKEKALAAADMMEKAIANNNIGYCSNGTKKYGRNACQYLAADVDYDLSKITTKTGCSCGDIVTLCIKYTGTDCPYVGSGPSVANALLARPDDFECFSDLEYVASDTYLERGDILVSAHKNGKNNHVCMVL